MAWKSGQSYAVDWRSRVLAAVDGGSPVLAVAARFAVGVSYVYEALGRRDATGETEARPRRDHQELELAPHHAAITAEVTRRSARCRGGEPEGAALFRPLGSFRHAAQGQYRPPSSHPTAEAARDQLGGV